MVKTVKVDEEDEKEDFASISITGTLRIDLPPPPESKVDVKQRMCCHVVWTEIVDVGSIYGGSDEWYCDVLCDS
jgi:hypothetical protein